MDLLRLLIIAFWGLMALCLICVIIFALILNWINKFAKWILRKDLNTKDEIIRNLRSDLDALKEKSKKSFLYQKSIELIAEILNDKSDILNLFCDVNFIMITYIKTYKNYSFLDVYVDLIELDTYNNVIVKKKNTKLQCKLYNEDLKSIKILDFTSRDRRKGCGSKALTTLLDICKEKEISTILGNLSSVDKKNWFYTIPFYQKYGFDIILNEKQTEGKIKRTFV